MALPGGACSQHAEAQRSEANVVECFVVLGPNFYKYEGAM